MKDEYEAYLAYCEDHKVPPVSPARYGEVRHFLQTDALRAEVEQLKYRIDTELGWVAFKDRMPPLNENCLVSYGGRFPIQALYKGDGAFMPLDTAEFEIWRIEEDELKYWMKVPENPKGSK
jgi:hypothetical protein